MKNFFAGKKVLLCGLGLQGGGEGVARFLIWAGARLTITDMKSEKELRGVIKRIGLQKAEFILGRHQFSDFKNADLIVKNPGVPQNSPYIKYAKKLGKPIFSETQIFFSLVPREKIIGVTGTKGKTTAAMLIAHLLKKRFKIILVGNIPERSALDSLIGLKTLPDFFVYELSSFNLEELKVSPGHAVITNIYPDHLNRYSGFKEYARVKENIFRGQSKEDVLWLNKEDSASKRLVRRARSRVFFFDPERKMDFGNKACLVSPVSLAAAVSVAEALGLSRRQVKEAVASFKPAEGRMQYLGRVAGAHVINDTAATNPGAPIFSVGVIGKCLGLKPSNMILIAGGVDKGDYADFSRKMKNLKKVILLPGSASEKIKLTKAVRVKTLKDAVLSAFKHAKKGDAVIFSPGAASFNMFKNEFDRGRAFDSLIRRARRGRLKL